MKTYLILFLSTLFLTFSSCGTKRRMTVVDPPVVETPIVPEVREPIAEPAVTIRTERVTIELPEDRVVHGQSQYFVIIGSFRISSNANRFKERVELQGFRPVILISEAGLHRICVDSFTDENEARARVRSIRVRFPQYHDTWLLKRK